MHVNHKYTILPEHGHEFFKYYQSTTYLLSIYVSILSGVYQKYNNHNASPVVFWFSKSLSDLKFCRQNFQGKKYVS